MPIRPIRLLFPVIVGSLISACSLALKPSPIPESVAELPDEFVGSEVVGSYEPLEWWKTFADPVLDQVIETVLASNFDLAEAVARVDQARARERIAKSSAFPLIQPSVGVNDFDTPYKCGHRSATRRGWAGLRCPEHLRYNYPRPARPYYLQHRRGIRLRTRFLGPQSQRRPRCRSRATGLGSRTT